MFTAINSQYSYFWVCFIQTGLIVSSQGQVLHVEGHFFWKFGSKHIVLVFSFTSLHILNQKGSVESEHNKGTTVGYDDEWIAGDCDEGMYNSLEVGMFVGASVNSVDSTKDGCEVGYGKVGCGDSKTVHVLHVCMQCSFTSLNSQRNIMLVFFLTHLQSLFVFENFNFGMLLDLSLHSEFELCDGLVDGMYEDNSVGSSEEYNVGTIDGYEEGIVEWWSLGLGDGVSVNNRGPTVGNNVKDSTFILVGCDVGKTVHLLHVFLQWLFTCLTSQTLFLFLCLPTHFQFLFLFENFNFGIISDLSLHPGCVKDECEVGNDEWLTVGCNDDKAVHISHVCLQ